MSAHTVSAKEKPAPKQNCGNCRFFKRWEDTIIGHCEWFVPMPNHFRRYGGNMRIEKEGHDFGEDCPAHQLKT